MSAKVTWKERIRHLKEESYALYFAYGDPRTPWYAKLFAGLLVLYVVSPIDLFPIPDFVPVLGQLDELVVVPVGVAIARKLVPAEVMEDSREKARAMEGKPTSRGAAALVIVVWLLVAALAVLLLRGTFA